MRAPLAIQSTTTVGGVTRPWANVLTHSLSAFILSGFKRPLDPPRSRSRTGRAASDQDGDLPLPGGDNEFQTFDDFGAGDHMPDVFNDYDRLRASAVRLPSLLALLGHSPVSLDSRARSRWIQTAFDHR